MNLLIQNFSIFLVSCCLATMVVSGEETFYLKNNDRVVFLGDSITFQNQFTSYLETYVLTRFPKLHVDFINSGWGWDRVTGGVIGTMEQRIKRDVLPYHPTVVTAMFGMNDGRIKPFNQEFFDEYKKGYEYIVFTLKTDYPDARIHLLQPSPCDDVTSVDRCPYAVPLEQGGGYNVVLKTFGKFVSELANREKLLCTDANTPVVDALKKGLKINPAMTTGFFGDRVHPSAAGGLLIALSILKSWNAPALVTSVEIEIKMDVPSCKTVKTHLTDLSLRADKSISWTQLDEALPFPLPVDPPATGTVNATVIKACSVIEDLDQQILKVTGLSQAKYHLKIGDQEIGLFSREQLQEGINLAILDTPMLKQASRVHEFSWEHYKIHLERWTQAQKQLGNETSQEIINKVIGEVDNAEVQAIVQKQREAAQPSIQKYSLRPQ